MRFLISLLFVIAALTSTIRALSADREGYFGLSVAVKGDGVFWNPVLKTITITQVKEGSPAQLSGIVAGEQIIAVEEKKIAGARANEISLLMEKKVGELLQLEIKNTAGQSRNLTLTAIVEPN
jgi:C-terminal processing protease CtpA/Prc